MTANPAEIANTESATPRKPMSRRMRILIFIVAWAIVLMPFLFWRGTWFGRPLSDAEITQYLRDDAKPRHIQHALAQIGDRIARGGRQRDSAARWYPEVVRLAGHPVEEIRNTDAWLMGQDPSRPEFHQALLKLLGDSSANVRANAALSLVSFGDAAGHDQIVSMLQPAAVRAPESGRIAAVAGTGGAIRAGTMLARIEAGGNRMIEVRSPITGKIRSLAVRAGDRVESGAELATVAPGSSQVWEALRALYYVGGPGDLPVIRPYQQPAEDFPAAVAQQARLAEKAIEQRQDQGKRPR